MMKSERWIGVLLVLLSLVSGLVIGRWLGATPAYVIPEGPETFRTWFWSHRSIDLAVQVGLMFAGALGVAAILPPPHEESP
jgi:hypothetical protein